MFRNNDDDWFVGGGYESAEDWMRAEDRRRRNTHIAWVLFWCTVIAIIVGALAGCHTPTLPTPAPVLNPVKASTANITKITNALTVFNILGFVGMAVSAGLFVFGLFSGNTLLERPALLSASICGGLVALSLAGIVALPFAPWIVLVASVGALAFAGYEIYAKYIRTPKAAKPQK